MDQLSRYHRVTVGLWARSHAELGRPAGQTCLAEAAVHALLVPLRRCADAGALLARYEAGAAADFAGVAAYPARVKCALLGWSALRDATLQATAKED